MRVIVAGGNGLLGVAAVQALVAAGHEVAVLSRGAAPAGSPVEHRRGDVTQPETLRGALARFDAVVDAVQFPNSPIENRRKGYTFERVDLGGTNNLVDAAKEQGIGLFIGLSGAGAAASARYRWQRLKWAEEEHIKRSGGPFVIFRPSWVYGPGDVSLNRFLGFARFLPVIPVVGNGRTQINPLFIDDLGAHVAAAVTCEAARNGTFEIGGPETLTMDAIIRAALAAAGKRRPLVHSPTAMMKLLARGLQFAPGRPLTPDAVEFITMDGVVDNAAVRSIFGLPLTPLSDGLRTYLPRGRDSS